jgi:hypothetical protein
MHENATFKAGKPPADAIKKLRCGRLAEMVGLTSRHVCKLAKAGKIPGAKRTKGGHFYFVSCPALGDWISDRRFKRALRKLPNIPKQRMPAILKPAWHIHIAMNHLAKNPPAPETMEALKEQLEPLVARLWPEKFPAVNAKTASF